MQHYLIPHAIEQSAERYPDHEALRCQGQSLTYAELESGSNKLARLLIDQGVRKRDRVGVYLNKSLETIVAIYGIMKTGAAYVPMDPLAPLSRLIFILNDCDIRHVVSHPPKLSTLIEMVAAESPLDCVIGVPPQADLAVRAFAWDAVNDMPDTKLQSVNLMEHDLAYIMYTSGSTGAPKGMMHTHYSGLSYAKMSAKVYGVNHTDRLSNHSPLHFDMSTFDYFTGPLMGATTIVIPEGYTKLPASLSKLIEDERITIWYSVTSALVQLLLRGVLEQRDLSALRWVNFGGEPFPPQHLYALMKLIPNARFSNVYGPAEVNQCTYYHVPSGNPDNNDSVPIGGIWENAEGLVADENDHIVADGEVGELLVRTPTMMKGYWKRADLNERAFYRRPVFAGYDDIFYRTGDLVQMQRDGNYRFLGRKDRQIKTRGYRVELDEIENVLSSHPAIAENAVYGIPNDEGGQDIAAAVILKISMDITTADLKNYLSDLVPHYAVPVQITPMIEFPRTGSGKIDRRALQTLAQERS